MTGNFSLLRLVIATAFLTQSSLRFLIRLNFTADKKETKRPRTSLFERIFSWFVSMIRCIFFVQKIFLQFIFFAGPFLQSFKQNPQKLPKLISVNNPCL